MALQDPRQWLLLIHQLPPKPDALRVKVWRRLQQVGAVAIKPSVYAMPVSAQAREDLSWILREIVEGGGDGSISEARFVAGLEDEQVVGLFQKARKADYDKILQEAHSLLAEWGSGQNATQGRAARVSARVLKLQRLLDDAAAIDFFQAPGRGTAEMLLKDLASRSSGPASVTVAARRDLSGLQGKKWVTRTNVFVDRLACGWLIRRFVDPKAVIAYVDPRHHIPAPGELRFDMFEGEFTHEGDLCTFEVLIQRLQLQDHALRPMAEVVHDIDLKDEKFGRRETDGFNALLTGLAAVHPDDDQRMTEGLRLFDNLYAYYQRRKRE